MNSAPGRPNIVLILIDDLGWRDLACQGSAFYETPHIDRLAAEGMSFSDAYASCPVCSPTRASVLTGRYPAAVGVTNFIDYSRRLHPSRGRLIDAPYRYELPQSETTIARLLGQAGYATWHVGKWHLGGDGFYPQDHGFEVNVGGCEVGAPGRSGYFSPWTGIPALADADVPEGTYLTDYLTDRAVHLIRHAGERPFFLNLWYYAVHTPIQAKPEKVEKYESKARRMGLDRVEPFVEGEYYPCFHKKDQRVKRRVVQSDPTYAAMIESLDEGIGRVLDALEETGQADHTLVVFTSDNGGLATAERSPTCNAPLVEGKGWMYEGGTRVPLIVRWPGVAPAGTVSRTPTTTPDLFPTCLEAAGLPPIKDRPIDGAGLLPVLRGGALPDRPIFWHYPHYGNQGGAPGSSVRLGDYKLIEFFEDGRLELYHLREDIGETRNLAACDPVRRDDLYCLLRTWREDVHALIPPVNPNYENEMGDRAHETGQSPAPPTLPPCAAETRPE